MREVRALAVDDSAAMRRAIVDVLRAVPGCVVVGEAANGAEALQLACTLRPDLIVMDIRMPVMGGLEAMCLLKREGVCVPVVLVTTSLEPEVREAALKGGAVACLEKGPQLWSGLPAIVATLSRASAAGPASP